MAESVPELTPLTSDECRRQERTHLFVAATLYIGTGSSPVHIRNMSPSGALIEGAVLPEQGADGLLRRGALEAPVKLVWVEGRKAGVSFGSPIEVAEWMSRTSPSHQGKVDEAVRRIRTGLDTREGQEPNELHGSPSSTLGLELRALRQELANLERGLSSDAALIATHPEVQLLDLALQRVDRMIASSKN